ncbi:MAG: dethiobiotin synthase, partial [Pygmaiobacter sp.]
MSKNLFITGTGTDVGKTFVAALIVKKLNDDGKKAAYYKAAMSGNERNADGNLIPGDALYVKTVSGIDQPLEQMCPYVYEQAVSPHLASRMEGNPVRLERVVQDFKSVCKTQDYVTMEGSGGILCPLCAEGTPLQLEDVIRELNLGCLLVATAGLGAINAVGLTAEYMRAHKIPLR